MPIHLHGWHLRLQLPPDVVDTFLHACMALVKLISAIVTLVDLELAHLQLSGFPSFLNERNMTQIFCATDTLWRNDGQVDLLRRMEMLNMCSQRWRSYWTCEPATRTNLLRRMEMLNMCSEMEEPLDMDMSTCSAHIFQSSLCLVKKFYQTFFKIVISTFINLQPVKGAT